LTFKITEACLECGVCVSEEYWCPAQAIVKAKNSRNAILTKWALCNAKICFLYADTVKLARNICVATIHNQEEYGFKHLTYIKYKCRMIRHIK